MQFTTTVPISTSGHPINYESRILSLGSCFAVNIADKLDYFKFRNFCNPFGILFHPLTIHEMIRRSILKDVFTDADVVKNEELWHCLDAHSDLSHPDKAALLENLNTALVTTHESLQSATHIILTYGTAWVYHHRESDKIVANCHKVPQSQFEKKLLDIAIIESAIKQTITAIAAVNPDCKIIFTISPVRHIKDGFVENQRSKAHLIAALQQVLSATSTVQASYFPSYEIMMDELRDYRFYASDMLHPNQTAVDYIWERFSQTHITATSVAQMLEIDSIQKGLQHKPFHTDSQSHRQFREKLNDKIQKLRVQFPHISF